MAYLKQFLTALMLLQFGCGVCFARMEIPEPPQPKGDYVVLLHGLGRSASSMRTLERALKKEGYRVVNVSYPSTKQTVEASASISLAEILQINIQDPQARVHFVTHSLGGIVLREYLAHNQITNLGRVVMLAPPNHGSELVDRMKNDWYFRFVTGPAGQQLGTDPESVPNRLGPANFDLGIIAGDRSWNPFFSARLPGPDDGKVTVASTQLEGMRDFLVVHNSHAWLPGRRAVVKATLRFLANNSFAETPQFSGAPHGQKIATTANGPLQMIPTTWQPEPKLTAR